MTETLTAPRPEPICGMTSWMPVPARIIDVHTENFNTKTFVFQFIDEEIRKMYNFLPGQFNMVYVPGVGEAAISISSDSHAKRLFASHDPHRRFGHPRRGKTSQRIRSSDCAARSALLGR